MKYEHISILKGTLTKEEVDKEDENFKTFFKDNNITVDLAENKGLKKLAYEIRKNRQGYFLRYEIETQDSNIFKLEKYARENDNIIKFITMRLDG